MRSEQTELNDEWSYIWGGGRYSASKFYRHSFIAVITPKPLKWIWKSKCVPKIKFFSWLLLKDKLNTRNMLRRRRKFLEEGYSCPVCLLDVEETRDHLFFGCSYARERWHILNINFNGNLGIYQRIKSAKRCFTQPFFMEIFMIGAWCIWQERNAVVFENVAPDLHRWKATLIKEVLLHFPRINPSLHAPIQQWLSLL